MKTTDSFKETIKGHLDGLAAADPLFATTYKKEGKNLEDCVTYILNTVHKSGCNGYTDDEIFGMAVHYYDEDNIDIGKPLECKVIVNHSVELTDAEKEEARKNAVKQFQDDILANMKKIDTKKKPQTEEVAQPTLF